MLLFEGSSKVITGRYYSAPFARLSYAAQSAAVSNDAYRLFQHWVIYLRPMAFRTKVHVSSLDREPPDEA